MLLGDHLRYFDRQKFWLTPGLGGQCNGFSGDPAVQRTNSHIGVDGRVARQFGNLIRPELGDRHLFGIDAGFSQYHV